MNNIYYYLDKPLFGLDIGFNSVKVMQLDVSGKQPTLLGYGIAEFDPGCIKDGVIIDPEPIAKTLKELFANGLVGKITTPRVALSVPASKTYTRTMVIPNMEEKDIAEAVKLETEQYIPVSLDKLYIDHTIVTKNDKQIELLAVATPKNIVDSYMNLAKITGLEVIIIEPTTSATGRLFMQTEPSDIPTILIDFGSVSSDITIYDKKLIITGTTPVGGVNFTDLIAKGLSINNDEAQTVKTKYGVSVSKRQSEIIAALRKLFDQLIKEASRMIRYYEERSGGKGKISQLITMGGGANMPGLSDVLTNGMRIPSRTCDPWQHLKHNGLNPPSMNQRSLYVTVAGLALANSKEALT